MDRGAWRATVHGVTMSRPSDRGTERTHQGRSVPTEHCLYQCLPSASAYVVGGVTDLPLDYF